MRFIGVSAGSASSYALSYGNAFYYGGQISDNLPTTAIMSPEEAWNIDTKIDDGLPAYGKVIARYWNDACSTANTGPSTFSNFDASYRLSDTTLQCAFFFRNIF